ncbi:hypothetical protein N665_0379s0025 [Sinapis alba]|nr:hypothetical protein N665_0379s0025 [Sinapis alba]
MEPNSLTDDDAEFSLPLEFLTDDDFLVEKENKSLFPYEPSHGFRSTVKLIGNEEKLLAGLTRKMIQSSPEDDFSGGFRGNDAKAWSATCGRRDPNSQRRVSSQAAAWDLYCAAAEELAMMNINGYNNHYDLSSYYSRQSLQYQKLQAIQFQQLKQQQLMKHHRHLVQQSRGLIVNNNKIAGHADLSPSAWSSQPLRRDDSSRRAVFLGNHNGKRGSTGTGVFLPRRVNYTFPATAESRKNPNASWRQRSNNGGFTSQMKMEQPVKEPSLPSDWAY